MKKIVFFSIPAHGHTNPMLPVAAQLVKRGNKVRFYSFSEFEDKIKKTAAEFIENAPHKVGGRDILSELNKANKRFTIIYWLCFIIIACLLRFCLGLRYLWISGLCAALLSGRAGRVFRKCKYNKLI